MGTSINTESIATPRTTQIRLRTAFGKLMDAYKTSKKDKRPPHVSEYSEQQLDEISRKAADIIHKDAPQLEKLIISLAKANGKQHALLIRDLPFEKDLPLPPDYINYPSAEWQYFCNERKGTFSDFFAMGAKQIIMDKTGYAPEGIDHAEIGHSIFRVFPQPFHRDNATYSSEKPRYSTLSCQSGNWTADTHLLNMDAAIAELTTNQKETLCKNLFQFNGVEVSILEKHDGKYYLSDYVYNPVDAFVGLGSFKTNDAAAKSARDAFAKAMAKHEDKINLRHGDFLLMDQKHLLHRGGAQMPLPRHLSGITFQAEPDRDRWTTGR